MIYLVLLEDTKHLVSRSNVRSAKDPLFPNRIQRPTPPRSDTKVPIGKPIIKSIQDYYDDPISLPVFAPDKLIGMTVLKKVDDDIVQAKVVRQIIDHDADNHQQIKFLLSLGDGESEEIISYNELSDLVNKSMQAGESGEQDFTTYSGILDHQGPLKKYDPKYKGSSYNVLVNWDCGTQTWEPLNLIANKILSHLQGMHSTMAC